VTSPPSNSTYGEAEDYLAIVQLVVNVIDCRESVMDEVVLVSERSVCAISHSHTAYEKESAATSCITAP